MVVDDRFERVVADLESMALSSFVPDGSVRRVLAVEVTNQAFAQGLLSDPSACRRMMYKRCQKLAEASAQRGPSKRAWVV